MYKGSFITEIFDPAKPTVNMKDWVEPTLYNSGESTVYLNGIAIDPGDSFIIGPAGVQMNGTLNLIFNDDNVKNEVRINYVLIVQNC